jgi:A/G-specific adenine glycosylase
MTEQFTKLLLKWHQTIDRKLPWKDSKDPYKIWISEIVMQQTRIAQGTSYYERIVKAFPTVQDMAKATEDEIMYLWKGLGYYSRARNMHKTARIIVDEFEGNFPKEYLQILALPGVGTYTAAAIASFAYDLPYAVLDGNVFRVLSRFFGIHLPIDDPKAKKLYQTKSQDCLGTTKPSEFNQAIMDFGAMQCGPGTPNCDQCVMSSQCHAYLNKEVILLPIKSKKIKRSKRYFTFFMAQYQGLVMIKKRDQQDIWQGLYEIPCIETPMSATRLNSLQTFVEEHQVELLTVSEEAIEVYQKLTHQDINATIIVVNVNAQINGYQLVSLEQLNNYAYPVLIENFIRQYVKQHIAF